MNIDGARTHANETPVVPAAPVGKRPLISTQRVYYSVATVKWPLQNDSYASTDWIHCLCQRRVTILQPAT